MANYVIFGGTFDPVHNGHMRIAMAASLRLNADIIFVPARSPRWKNPITSAKHRLNMLKLAIKTSCPSGSRIDEFELNSKADINYTIDTVKYFKKKYPEDNLFLIIGADQVNRFSEWKSAEELSSLATIVYVERPNYELDKKVISTYHMKSLRFSKSGDISSTDFRALKNVDVPPAVLKYIEDNRLYFFSILEEYLDENRLNHSIQVANLAYLIAIKNKIDNPEKAYIAGLLHDLGKTTKYTRDDQISFMKKNYPEHLDLPSFSYHQFIGVYLAKELFRISDEDILNAIKYHCTGAKNMSTLGQIIYAADKIEPTRGFDSRWLINSCIKNYHQGFVDTLVDNKKYLLAHNKDITNKLTDECFNMYLPKEKNNAKKR